MLIRSIASGAAFGILSLLAQAVAVVIIARNVGAEEYGYVTVVLALVAFSQIFTEIGLSQSLIQRKNIATRHVSTAFYFSILISLIVFLAFLILSEVIAELLRMPPVADLVVVGATVFVVRAYGGVFEAIAYRRHRFIPIARADFFGILTGYLGVALPLAMLGFGAVAVVIGAIAHQIVRVVLIRSIIRLRVTGRWDWGALREMLAYGAWFSVARFLNYLATQADNLIVGRYLGPEALGFYGRIFQIIVAPATQLAGVVSNILFPVFSKKQDKKDDLHTSFSISVASLLVATLPIAITLCVYAESLVLFLFGSDWSGMVLPLQILVLALPFRAAYKAADPLFKAMNWMKTRALIQFAYACAIVAAAVIGAQGGLADVALFVSVVIFLHFVVSVTGGLLIIDRSIKDWIGILVNPCRFLIACLLVNTIFAFFLQYLSVADYLRVVAMFVVLGVQYLMILIAPQLLFTSEYAARIRVPKFMRRRNKGSGF
ncbi:oligosaccharide flippase family protein [Thauera mechernichensis]